MKKILLLLSFLSFLQPSTQTAHAKSSWQKAGERIGVGSLALCAAHIIGSCTQKIDASGITPGLLAAVGGMYAFVKVPELLARENDLTKIAHKELNMDHAVTNTLISGALGYLVYQGVKACGASATNPAAVLYNLAIGLGVGATIHHIGQTTKALKAHA